VYNIIIEQVWDVSSFRESVIRAIATLCEDKNGYTTFWSLVEFTRKSTTIDYISKLDSRMNFECGEVDRYFEQQLWTCTSQSFPSTLITTCIQLAMPHCTRKGCGRNYDLATNDPSSCTYHPGAPVSRCNILTWNHRSLVQHLGLPRRPEIVVLLLRCE
jgi:hypothetical protein